MYTLKYLLGAVLFCFDIFEALDPNPHSSQAKVGSDIDDDKKEKNSNSWQWNDYLPIYATLCLLQWALFFWPLIEEWNGAVESVTNYELFGFGIAIFGHLLRQYCIRFLGDYFTYDIAVQNNQKIVDRSIYGIIRHPSYLGCIAWFVGNDLFANNWASKAFFLINTITVVRKIPLEEKVLLENEVTARQYSSYKSTVPYRLLPYVF